MTKTHGFGTFAAIGGLTAPSRCWRACLQSAPTSWRIFAPIRSVFAPIKI